METTEIEILDGARAFSKTQELFVGAPASKLYPQPVECGWFDEYISPYRGAFMLVQDEDGPYADFVGDFFQVVYKRKHVYVYCVGTEPELETPIALARRPYLALTRLTLPSIQVYPMLLT